MKEGALTISAVVKGKIGNILGRMMSVKISESKQYFSYRLIKDVTPIFSTVKNRVGIYQDPNGDKVVIKKTGYTWQNLNVLYLKNEARILKNLAWFKEAKKIVPEFKELVEQKNEIGLVTEFVKGTRLDLATKKDRVRIVSKTYERLQRLSRALEKERFYGLTIRNPLSYLISFPAVLTKLIFRSPIGIGIYFKLAILFYLNYFWASLRRVSYGLSHRDLWPDNILFSSKNSSITLLDWESAVATDSLYDLSLTAMIYFKDFGQKKMTEFLQDQLETNIQRKRFFALAIYNSFQTMANTSKKDKVFQQTQEFIQILTGKIMPDLMYRKSPYEIVNTLTLEVIWLFYRLTGLAINNRNKKIILCYHSVGNDGWRFSTRVKTFRKHLNYLKKNFRLTSLKELLLGNEGGLHISFDDGYKNLLNSAQSILSNAKVPPTLFAIGDRRHANRTELDNSLPLMNIKEIRHLRKRGWEIGFHTKTHPNLSLLNDSQLRREIVEGKRDLEKRLGFRLQFFAYPKGSYNKKIVSFVKTARFKAAFTVDGKEVILKSKNNLLLDRVPIDGELTVQQLAALLSPIGMIVSRIFLRILGFKERYFKFTHVKA